MAKEIQKIAFSYNHLGQIIQPHHRVLDIGCNVGFLSLMMANQAKHVDGFDSNKSLIDVAKIAKKLLDVKNCSFFVRDLKKFSAKEPYDVVLSLAIHQYMKWPFKKYARWLSGLLEIDGVLLFETHDTYKYDSDINHKVKILETVGLVNITNEFSRANRPESEIRNLIQEIEDLRSYCRWASAEAGSY